jgi:hypothetical protein
MIYAFISFCSALNKFLYSAVSGLPDHIDMNDVTKSVLYETYRNLMSQVDNDAPTVLAQLKSQSNDSTSDSNIETLSDVIHDGSINPFNVPSECILKNKTVDLE